jgi:hypothetical protein
MIGRIRPMPPRDGATTVWDGAPIGGVGRVSKDGDGGVAVSVVDAPQFAQNFAPGGSSVPHSLQNAIVALLFLLPDTTRQRHGSFPVRIERDPPTRRSFNLSLFI